MTIHKGNRQPLPSNASSACPSCGRRRGNTRAGWVPITKDGAVLGYTCPDCPRWDEPIRREPSGRFLAVVGGTRGTDGKRHQLKRRFDDLPTAREWVSEALQGVVVAIRHSQPYTDPSRLTVRMICDRWLERQAARVSVPGGIRAVTVSGYRSSLHALLLQIGDQVAREVTADDVEAALQILATKGGKWGRALSHRSVVYALGSLRQAFSYGARQKWLTTNVASFAKAPGKNGTNGGSRRAMRWSPEELKRFRAHADTYASGAAQEAEPWIHVGMRLSLCGLRRSEVLGLDWANVDIDAGTVKIVASRVKTGHGSETAIAGTKTSNSKRLVDVESIHRGCKVALRELWLKQGRPASGLLIRDSMGIPVHPDTFSRRFKALCAEAGVFYPGSVHNLRHTIATAFSEAGVPDHQAAALLGHDVATYRRFYLVTDDDAAAEAAKAAGRIFAAL